LVVPLHIDSIAALQAFVAAAEARSFKTAGIGLGVTSSAIGKAIARLESQLGVQLFHRTTRTVSLTEQGSLFLARAKQALDVLEVAEAELTHTTEAPRGTLRVSLPLTGSVLTAPLAEFVLLHPQISLELDFTDRLVDVIDEGFDAVIRTGEPADSRLMHRKLGSFAWRLVASPGYIQRAGAPRSVAELANHNCLRQRLSTGRLAPWPLEGAEDLVIPATLTASIIEPLLELAVAGVGIAAFPQFMVERLVAEGKLVSLLSETLNGVGTLNILWPASRYNMPKTRVFIDFLATWSRLRFSAF